MKTKAILFFFAFIPLILLSQELQFVVEGNYKIPLQLNQISHAKTVKDLIADYPSAWIDDYTSVELIGSCQGKTLQAKGKNEVLTPEQLNMLQHLDLNSDLKVNILYTYRNPVSNQTENNKIKINLTIVPEKQAQFAAGNESMKAYIHHSPISKFAHLSAKNNWEILVYFTVNEKGDIENTKVIRSSGDADRDSTILQTLQNMPQWKPAENAKGEKVKQVFRFAVGNRPLGGGC